MKKRRAIKKKSLICITIITLSLILVACQNNNNIESSSEIESSDIDKSSVEENSSEFIEKEYSKEIKELIEKAEVGDIEAMNTLSYYYFNGFGVEKDYDEFLKWSHKSAEAGNLASMFNLAYNYYYGFAGEKNYELAFKWYKKAASEMFPKALNALGHMYYNGLGVEKNIDLAIEYTHQSAGFLHNYSYVNMGSIIDDLDLDQDSNFWYRLAAKNYNFRNESNEILYENLVKGEVEIEKEYKVKESNIPKELIEDILLKYYSGTLYEYLELSSLDYKDFNLDEMDIEEDIEPFISNQRWFDSNYFIDLDGDEIKELLIFNLDGTMGISSLKILKENNARYEALEDKEVTFASHGINGIITYNNKKYFIIAGMDISNRSIWEVNIYQFDGYEISDPVTISLVEGDIKVIKTYQISDKYDDLINSIEKRIDEIFVEKTFSNRYDKLDQTIKVDADINNDGDRESYEYETLFYGTINRPLYMELSTKETSEKDREIINKVLAFNDLARPIGIEIFSKDNTDYVSVVAYEEGSNNHCLTTFKLEKDKMTVISNHLIVFDEKFIIEDGSKSVGW